MNKSERLELQRQLTNAEAKFLKYRGSGVIPTPKALRYRRPPMNCGDRSHEWIAKPLSNMRLQKHL